MEEVMSLSVIIPCYNAQDTVSGTIHNLIDELESAVRKFPNFKWEIIAVNDGSTDSTLEVLNAIKLSPGSKIKVLSKKNSGVSDTRNYGLQEARGEYIWFFDADDLLFDNSVTALISYLMKRPDILRFTSFTLDNKTKNTINSYNNSYKSKIQFDGKYENYLKSNLFGFSCWSLIVKRDLLEENQIKFDNRFVICEDVLWNLNVALKCRDSRIITTNLKVVKYVVRDNSTVNATDNERIERQLNASLQIFNELQDEKYRVGCLRKSIDYYSEAVINQVITRFLSRNMGLGEIRKKLDEINMILSNVNYDNKVIKFYYLVSKNVLLAKLAQILYRHIFLELIKPRLGRN